MNDIGRILFVERSVEPFGCIPRFSDNLNYFENYGRTQPLQVFDCFEEII